MVFSSLFFLFGFFSIHLIVYFFSPPKYRNRVLLISSLIFYSWGGPRYLILLMGETLVSWLTALQIERTKQKKLWLWVECIALLGLLGIFKYTDFFLGNIQFLTGWPKTLPNIVLPIGISFYTFQLLSYVIDVYRKEVKAQPNYWKLLLYSSLFHQCIAGPIVRYETVQNEIDHRHVTFQDVYDGLRRFCIGLAKKAILANSIASVGDTLVPSGVDAIHGQCAVGIWLSMLCYMLQIYLDFSAYSDMAIGMGRMVGFHYLENFNYPYTAKSVQDFWRRWHISLSTFFRDYIYIPLGGNRCSQQKWIRNMFVVWFLTGMWHGASWNYILWGLYYFVFLMLERFVWKQPFRKGLNHVYTLLVIFFGWIIFKYPNLNELTAVLTGMFGIGSNGFLSMEVRSTLISNIYLLIFCLIACTSLGKKLQHILKVYAKKNTVAFGLYATSEMILPVLLLVLSSLALIGDSYNPFLYFQF